MPNWNSWTAALNRFARVIDATEERSKHGAESPSRKPVAANAAPAAARRLTVGHRCATVGPRSLRRRGVNVRGQGCGDLAVWAGIGAGRRKARRGQNAGRAREGFDAMR